MKTILLVTLLMYSQVFAAGLYKVKSIEGKEFQVSGEELDKGMHQRASRFIQEDLVHKYSINMDGSITLNYPKYRYNGQLLPIDATVLSYSISMERRQKVEVSVCSLHNIGQFVDSDLADNYQQNGKCVSLDPSGNFLSHSTCFTIFKTVTCRPNWPSLTADSK